jgi:hypothetical protein
MSQALQVGEVDARPAGTVKVDDRLTRRDGSVAPSPYPAGGGSISYTREQYSQVTRTIPSSSTIGA